MESPDELRSWTEDEIAAEIARSIPEDAQLVCEWIDSRYSARVESVAAGGAVKVIHACEHVDRRMALYDVYGYLWLQRRALPASGSTWDPRSSRPSIASVSEYVRSSLPDPGDLDPEEIAAVYGIPSSRKRDG